ncbi:MAG: efflux transporter outer membrane subunit [Pseudomonadota bacterium]|nr:efflux transporter outer membrane subunit [Pseudomonadota bacterium]
MQIEKFTIGIWPLALILTSSAALLSGCTVGPDYKSPLIDLPSRWPGMVNSKSMKPIKLARWWGQFNDATLDSLIEHAVVENLDVTTAKAKLREARANAVETGASTAPSVSNSGSATVGKSSGNDQANTQFKLGFDASWELDLFGGNHRSVEAAIAGTQAAEEDLKSTLVTLIGDVATYYIDARGYQARIALARRTSTSLHNTAVLTKISFNSGSATAADVAKAEALATGTEANIPSFEAALAIDYHRLSILLGKPPAALQSLFQNPKAIPSPKLPLPSGIPADMLRNRPDIRAAERRLAQATATIGLSQAAQYPSLSLNGSISTSALSLGSLASSTAIGWSLGPSLTIPIFNGGKLQAAVQVTQAQRDQTYIKLRATTLTALEDVENALVSLSSERRKNNLLTSSSRNYSEALQIASTLYKSGSSSFLDLLDAERSLYSSDDSLLQSRIAFSKDYVALAKALGGGWDGAIDSSQAEVTDIDTGPRVRH